MNSAAKGGGEGHLRRIPPPRFATYAYHPLKCIIFRYTFYPLLFLALLACFGCALLCSLAVLLALEGLHPLKLDEVGFCFVPFRLILAWQLDLFLDVTYLNGWRTLALCLLCCGSWQYSSKFFCFSGLFWWLDKKLYVSLFGWLDTCSLVLLPWRWPVWLAWRVPRLAWPAGLPFPAVLSFGVDLGTPWSYSMACQHGMLITFLNFFDGPE